MKSGLFIISGLVLMLFCLPESIRAQEEVDTVASIAGIEIETSVDRAEIYIGDLISYRITITRDSTIEMIPPPLGANLGAFDVKDYQPDIETKLPDGRLRSETVFMLSTFTTGDYVIPPIPVIFIMPDSTKKALLAEPVPIKVLSMLENAGDSVDIHPLKPQYEFMRDYTRYYIWGAMAVVVFLSGVVLVWWLVRRRKQKEAPVDMRPPWEIAFEKLAVLKEKNYPGENRYKDFYFELTEIYRDFLGRVYLVDVLEMTTEEFLTCFEKIVLPGNTYDESEKLLRYADLVKFAKLIPESVRAESDLQLVHDMVEALRSEQERHTRVDVHVDGTGDKNTDVVSEATP